MTTFPTRLSSSLSCQRHSTTDHLTTSTSPEQYTLIRPTGWVPQDQSMRHSSQMREQTTECPAERSQQRWLLLQITRPFLGSAWYNPKAGFGLHIVDVSMCAYIMYVYVYIYIYTCNVYKKNHICVNTKIQYIHVSCSVHWSSYLIVS